MKSSWNVDSDSTIGRNFPFRIHEIRAVYFQLLALEKMRVSAERCPQCMHLLFESLQWSTNMKKHEIVMVFRGNIVSDVTADTLSDIGMLFGTFHMKNIFIDFPTPILNHYFGSI